MKNKTLVIIGIFALILFAVVLLFSPKKSNDQTPGPIQIPAAVIEVISQYIQYRENSVGVDQPNPNSWLQQVKPITTPEWYSRLQPNPDTLTGSSSAEYKIAHTNGYTVKASVFNCTSAQPIETQGTIRCEVTNKTIKNGSEVPASSLPFGWTRNGQQLASTIKVVNINGRWLVDEDIISQGD